MGYFDRFAIGKSRSLRRCGDTTSANEPFFPNWRMRDWPIRDSGRMRRIKRVLNLYRAIMLGCGAWPALYPLTANAQSFDEPSHLDAQEIVVTAQRREEVLSRVPIAIQAIDGETLEKTGTNQLTDLVKFLPGVSTVSSVSPGYETVQIRGISSGAFGDSTIAYYVDDVPFSIPNLQLAPPSRLFDLERAEVLRGPQGTLYGAGAEGGLIRLITAAPSLTKAEFRERGELSFTDGGGTNYNFDGVLGIPIVTDKVGLRITGGYEKLSGFARSSDNPSIDDVNGVKSYSIRSKLLIRPIETLNIALSAWRIRNRQNYSNNLLSVDPPTAHRALETEPYVKTVANIFSGLITWDASFSTLQSATSYLTHQLAFDLTAAIGTIPGLGATSNHGIINFRTHSFSQEFRIVSEGAGPFKWLAGGIYTDSTITSNFTITLVPQFAPTVSVPFTRTVDTPLTTKAFAVYGEASYDLLDDRLKPLIGLRYYHDHRKLSDTTSIAGRAFVTLTSADSFNSFSPRFSLSLTPDNNGLVYVNAAKGFRSGTLQTATQVLLAAQSGVTTRAGINPDHVWSYELGTKRKLGSTGLSIELTGYYSDWSDVQVPFTTLVGLPSAVNGADAEIYGFDAGFAFRVMRGLTLSALGNLNSAKFKHVDPQLAAALPTAKNGRRLPGVPRANVTVSGTYSTRLSDDWSLDLYGSYAYRGRQSDFGSGLYSTALDQVALRAGVGWKNWTLDIFVDNLTNEKGPSAVSPIDVQGVYPRRFGMTANVRL